MGTRVKPEPSSDSCAPLLNSFALLSLLSPLIITIVPLVLPFALSLDTSALPCSLPTFSLSNET